MIIGEKSTGLVNNPRSHFSLRTSPGAQCTRGNCCMPMIALHRQQYTRGDGEDENVGRGESRVTESRIAARPASPRRAPPPRWVCASSAERRRFHSLIDARPFASSSRVEIATARLSRDRRERTPGAIAVGQGDSSPVRNCVVRRGGISCK